ncbi:MAG: VWA domain-containing protein [Verrucomicrobiota bacterium]
MSEQMIVSEFANPFHQAIKEAASNPEPRCPSLLLLDVSGSMAGERIKQLISGLRIYQSELAADPIARKKVEVAVVTFGEKVEVIQDFTVAPSWSIPEMNADGATPMAEAIVTGLELLESRKRFLRSGGLEIHRPWVFLITDGEPTDREGHDWDMARRMLLEGQKDGSFLFFAVGVEGANMDVLGELSQVVSPMNLKGVKFRELFQWLSASQKSVAASRPGDKLKLALPPCIEIES